MIFYAGGEGYDSIGWMLSRWKVILTSWKTCVYMMRLSFNAPLEEKKLYPRRETNV